MLKEHRQLWRDWCTVYFPRRHMTLHLHRRGSEHSPFGFPVIGGCFSLSLQIQCRLSVGCVQCLVKTWDIATVCELYEIDKNKGKYAGNCYKALDRLFNNNLDVIDAGKVGKGHVNSLTDIMNELFLNLKTKKSVWEKDLQAVAKHFIAEASKLPRGKCIGPCGYQEGQYSCVTCKIDSCDFPLDCPVQSITAAEDASIKILCDVKFPLPQDKKILKVWKYAEKMKTQQVELFEELMEETDNVYFIPSASVSDEGTYQCEIFSNRISMVRVYYYLTGGKLHVDYDGMHIHPTTPPLSRTLIAICFTSLLLLLILSLGVMIMWKRSGIERIRRNEEL
ncbi:sperm acrosome membrane-associated protein 6 isoform X2 [Vanacampus margaritifer]